MQGIKWGSVLRSILSASPPFGWMTLSFMWLCAQMSLARIWVGGHPALCLSPMDQHLQGLNRLGLSLYLRGRGSWRPPASLSWTALTLMSVWVCVFGMNLYKWRLACVEQIMIELLLYSFQSGWDCWPQISQQLQCGHIFDGWHVPRDCGGEEKWVRNYFISITAQSKLWTCSSVLQEFMFLFIIRGS